jgi:CelD/BcsL family acetyltransferase involved in cellulose biosynthesis
LHRTFTARSVAELECLRPRWEELYRSSVADPRSQATLFQSFELNLLAARAFSDCAPHVVLSETSFGATLIPAAMARDEDGKHSLRFLGEEMFDYRDYLTVGDDEAAIAAWEQVGSLGLPLQLTAVREGAHPQVWKHLSPQPYSGAPGIDCHDISAEQFWHAHVRVGSRVRKLERAGACFRTASGNDSRLVRWIYQQKARQLAGDAKNVFADQRRIDFMVAACALPSTNCEIFLFEAGSEIVSALVTFRDHRTRLFYTIFFDERWRHYSPGILLLYEVTRRTLAEGLNVDYLTGEQPHKMRFATRSVPLFTINAPARALQAMAQELAAVRLAA